jgi:selenocysteine-specific elongation factor
VIVGTAGHVDHGKTSLVKALTGIDTDRLPEEKKRGITTELGFAHLVLSPALTVGVVDVPGHERFVKAMAAGAGGVDLALLVIAADEGVMPQTREHVDICTLLGVRAGILVVTKADLLPGLGTGWLELLEADIRSLVEGTFLEDAPLVTVSSKSGEGLERLKAQIAEQCGALASTHSSARPEGPAFLPVDRAFSLKGFGTVVTGTLLSGQLVPEDSVCLLPGLPGPFRVRSIQIHGEKATQAVPGQRVALNLTPIEAEQVKRGMAVARAGEVPEARVLDVELSLLPSVPAALGRRTRQLLSLGTAHVETLVRLLDVDALRPGERCFAQLRLAAPVAALPNQRFILRGSRALDGRGATVAGGRVLTLNPGRRKRGAAEKLSAFAEGDAQARVGWLLTEAGYAGLTEKELYAKAGVLPKELGRVLETSAARGRLVGVDKEARRFLSAEVFAGLSARTMALLDAFHRASPEKDGMPREELRQRLGVPHERTFAKLLSALVEAEKVEADGELARLRGRRRTLGLKAGDERHRLLVQLEKAALQPPLLAELSASLGQSEPRVLELLKVLSAEGQISRAGELWFSSAALKALEDKLLAHFKAHSALTTQQFKEMTGLSRKFLIPLAEYFDAQKITLRVGEKRVLRKKPATPPGAE